MIYEQKCIKRIPSTNPHTMLNDAIIGILYKILWIRFIPGQNQIINTVDIIKSAILPILKKYQRVYMKYVIGHLIVLFGEFGG